MAGFKRETTTSKRRPKLTHSIFVPLNPHPNDHARDFEPIKTTPNLFPKPSFQMIPSWHTPRTPSGALLPFLGEGSPTKIDYKKTWYPHSNLSSGGPRHVGLANVFPHNHPPLARRGAVPTAGGDGARAHAADLGQPGLLDWYGYEF